MTDQPEPETTRRSFVKVLATGVVAATTAIATGTIRPAAQTDGKKAAGAQRKAQYAMVIDVRRCIGCHSCTVACKSEFDVPMGEERAWVEYVEKGEYPYVGRSFLPRLCNHCSVPPCVSVCPVNATYKRDEDGAVVVDVGLCIGCKYCIQACPYDARFLNPLTGTADKCDFCLHRTSQGLVPSCVNTCIGEARHFGDINDPTSSVAQLVASERVTVLRGEMGTLPNVYYIGADHTDLIDAQRSEVRKVRVANHRRHSWRR